MSEQQTATLPEPKSGPKIVPKTPPSSSLKLLAHLKQYPLISQTRDMVLQIPFTKTALETISPSLKAVSETQPFKIVLDKSDLAADSMLYTLDKSFPRLKHFAMNDFIDPISRPINGTAERLNSEVKHAKEQIDQNILTPTAKAAFTAKESFSALVIDNQGKGIISSQADPIIGPVNDKLEELVQAHLPDTKKVSKRHSSELSRSMRLIKNVLTRTKAQPEATSPVAVTTTEAGTAAVPN
ncbi:uncharacterized protein KQ657_002702 [Scheffersomyces spartinae]|uniref:Uncharacterized protein n=1 Tax=Scheffersomyces spartinae TaxID=45513 RepID=A0A9P7V5U6_9ASCO|nr:uncharacterized protein KQ657_002702 [Scheffersomyces spartinae]KAG7191913.1 hypothetical protein KQ657_002702 [Scheffersomyces spartinae]